MTQPWVQAATTALRNEIFSGPLESVAFVLGIANIVLLIRRRPSLTPYVMIGYQAVIKVVLGASLAVIGVLVLGAGLGEGLIGPRNQAAVLVAAVGCPADEVWFSSARTGSSGLPVSGALPNVLFAAAEPSSTAWYWFFQAGVARSSAPALLR